MEEIDKKEKLEQYVQEVIQEKVIPFFKEYLPDLYDENVDIVIDFKDGAKDDVKIGADKNSNQIHYHIYEEIVDLENIREQETTFQQITGEKLKHNIKLPRKEADALHLIHEFTHKYHWNLIKENASYLSASTINREYFFPAVEKLKSIGIKMHMSTPMEVFEYVNEMKKGKEIPEEIKEEMEFLSSKDIGGVDIIKFAKDKLQFDNNCGIDADETLAKSVERIYIEHSDLNPDVKNTLLTYRQDWFENHPIIETEDKESQKSKTYAEEVFYRLYENVEKDRFVELVKNLNYLEFSKMQIKNPTTGEETKEYIEFLQNPEKYLETIKEYDGKGDPVRDANELLSSKEAERVGINTFKYRIRYNGPIQNIQGPSNREEQEQQKANVKEDNEK